MRIAGADLQSCNPDRNWRKLRQKRSLNCEGARDGNGTITPVSGQLKDRDTVTAAILVAITTAAVKMMARGIRMYCLTGDSGKKGLHIHTPVVSAEMDVEAHNCGEIQQDAQYRGYSAGPFHLFFEVSSLTALISLINCPATSRITVYAGIATSIPVIPPIFPAIRKTMNISRG